MNHEDSIELRWIREALEKRNELIKEQNVLLSEIKSEIRRIYEGMP